MTEPLKGQVGNYSPSPVGQLVLSLTLAVFVILFGECQARSMTDIIVGSVFGGLVFICVCGCLCVMNIAVTVCYCMGKANRTPSTSHTITRSSLSGQAGGIYDQDHPKPALISLPEATLHRGDAPPAYAEAIRMKTVVIEDLDNT